MNASDIIVFFFCKSTPLQAEFPHPRNFIFVIFRHARPRSLVVVVYTKKILVIQLNVYTAERFVANGFDPILVFSRQKKKDTDIIAHVQFFPSGKNFLAVTRCTLIYVIYITCIVCVYVGTAHLHNSEPQKLTLDICTQPLSMHNIRVTAICPTILCTAIAVVVIANPTIFFPEKRMLGDDLSSHIFFFKLNPSPQCILVPHYYLFFFIRKEPPHTPIGFCTP